MIKKRIYFEGLGLVEGHFSGIGQYILGTLRGIDAILEREKLAGNPVPDVRVIIPYNTLDKFQSYKFKHIRAKRLPITFRTMARLWHHNLMPPLDLWCGRGYYIFTRFVTMPLVFSKSSVVIYDLSYEHYRQYSDERNANFLSKGVKKSIKQVEKVFAISENGKQEIASFYNLPKNDVIVATPAADQRYFYRRSEQEINKVKQKYGIKKNYILALSNLEPRKNLDLLVDAYCKLPEKYRKDISLLLVGVSGWKTDALFAKIVELVKDGYDIVRPSEYVSDKDKPAIISGAKMLVYPSHYEGFGMPPLEALACGVPVISADNSSLPEVVGDAGVLLNCTDLDGFVKHIKHHLDNIEAVSAKTITAGPEQASNFAWEKSAQQYWDLIMEKTK
ncbi:MAG: glycosyltransferase family 1 protein [Candidatus Saccharibacteria bacterium]|nr:glycosyltransferase family 1 protein [Candidatus Saccharibacteria bacterium]